MAVTAGAPRHMYRLVCAIAYCQLRNRPAPATCPASHIQPSRSATRRIGSDCAGRMSWEMYTRAQRLTGRGPFASLAHPPFTPVTPSSRAGGHTLPRWKAGGSKGGHANNDPGSRRSATSSFAFDPCVCLPSGPRTPTSSVLSAAPAVEPGRDVVDAARSQSRHLYLSRRNEVDRYCRWKLRWMCQPSMPDAVTLGSAPLDGRLSKLVNRGRVPSRYASRVFESERPRPTVRQ
jgi:hypothetical protein